ncbi:30S ribosomal protein S6 [candidate division WWE3 bacterium]|uniref:Small ribosomal subunit protein bS6 n=1 Tax=candidate division WWE3 bacterium TaxID=2053526 RepID=A0A7X9E7F3_UNCKA|nr:30S ribosomal protein S6 [candidate division WWE3 bacterium]
MKYEIMAIYKNDLGEEGAANLSKKMQEIITSLGAKVVETNFWGRRKFAYEINHSTEGFYDVISIECESSIVAKLRVKLNLLSGLVRYLITAQK